MWPTTGSFPNGGPDAVYFIADDCTDSVTYEYDLNGQPLRVRQESPAGTFESRIIRRDNIGRVLHEIGFNDVATTADDAAATTTRAFDANGSVIWQIQNERKTSTTYGSRGPSTGLVTASSIGYVGASSEMSAAYTLGCLYAAAVGVDVDSRLILMVRACRNGRYYWHEIHSDCRAG